MWSFLPMVCQETWYLRRDLFDRRFYNKDRYVTSCYLCRNLWNHDVCVHFLSREMMCEVVCSCPQSCLCSTWCVIQSTTLDRHGPCIYITNPSPVVLQRKKKWQHARTLLTLVQSHHAYHLASTRISFYSHASSISDNNNIGPVCILSYTAFTVPSLLSSTKWCITGTSFQRDHKPQFCMHQSKGHILVP